MWQRDASFGFMLILENIGGKLGFVWKLVIIGDLVHISEKRRCEKKL